MLVLIVHLYYISKNRDLKGEMEILTDPLPTQLSTVAHTDTQESDKCTDADAGRLRPKP